MSEYIVFKRDWLYDVGVNDKAYWEEHEVKDAMVITGDDRAIAAITRLSGAMGQYRANLVAQGFASNVADQMAQQAQTLLMQTALGNSIVNNVTQVSQTMNRAQRRASATKRTNG